MKFLKTLVILLVVVAVFCAAMFALNFYTAPIIDEYQAEQAAKALGSVMGLVPEGATFGADALVYDANDASASELPNVDAISEHVLKIYQDNDAKVFIVTCKTIGNYNSNEPIQISFSVVDGKIHKIQIDSYPKDNEFDVREKAPDFISSFEGENSALSNVVEIGAGCTISSSSIKNAVSAGLSALISNNLIAEGKKTPEQILKEMIATVAPEMTNEGVFKPNPIECNDDTIVEAHKNASGYVYIMTDADAYYLVIVNTDNQAKVYDIDGADVTASKSALADKASAHAAAQALGGLLAVLPEGSTFGADAEIDLSTLTGVSEQVIKIYKEATGKGYAIQCKTVPHKYSSAPTLLTIGVSSDGKIIAINIDEYNDSWNVKDKAPGFMDSFVGKDSALEGVIVGGATYSTGAIKNAVSAGLEALIANNMITAGVKSDEQILTELIPTVHTGMNAMTEIKNVTGNIKKAYKASNDTGYAYVILSGESNYLAVVNATGVCTVYDVEGNVVENTAVADEAIAHFDANKKDFSADVNAKFGRMVAGAADFTPIVLEKYNNLAYAATFTAEGKTYYGFYSRVIGFQQMDIYVVIDDNGAIVKTDAKEFVFEQEYFFGLDPNFNVTEYKNGFVGITGDTFTGNETLIGGATMSSNAVKNAIEESFNAFESIKNGGEQ